MSDTELTVIGGGVVGLAVAARLAHRVRDLVLVERRERVGQETSSRNSEVVHAGLYYPQGTLKARLCVRGNVLLRERATRLGLPFGATGKLVVALDETEEAALAHLLGRARANGARVSPLTMQKARELEPAVPAVAAFLSPDTAITSAHDLMDSLRVEACSAGAAICTRSEVVALERRTSDWLVTVRSPEGLASHSSERVVNAAGLDADTVAGLAGLDVAACGYRQHWWKGSYFALRSGVRSPISRLVYPVPETLSLGTHAILGLDGRLRFGPDVELLGERRQDYSVPDAKRNDFALAVGRLLPAVREADLVPDTSGIRPKLQGPGEGFRDFVITDESDRGLPGLVNLVGIDSPGLTSALAIAEQVERLLAA